MKRRYRKELYQQKIEYILARIPHAAIGADVIVGYPGETDDDFKETVDFINELPISYLHVFTYSERAGTTALGIKPVVPIAIRNERNKTLRNLSYQKLKYFNEQHRGKTRPVLFEANKNGLMEGYTDNYIKIITSFDPKLVNQIVEWSI